MNNKKTAIPITAENNSALNDQCQQITTSIFTALQKTNELTRANNTNKPVLKPDTVVIALRKVIIPVLQGINDYYLQILFLTELAKTIENYCNETGIASHNIRPNDIYPFSSLDKKPLPTHVREGN